MNQTEHYGLKLPESGDPFSLRVFNENAQTIDSAMHDGFHALEEERTAQSMRMETLENELTRLEEKVDNASPSQMLCMAHGYYDGDGQLEKTIETAGMRPCLVMMREVAARGVAFFSGTKKERVYAQDRWAVDGGWSLWRGEGLEMRYHCKSGEDSLGTPFYSQKMCRIEFTAAPGSLRWAFQQPPDESYADEARQVNNRRGVGYEWFALGYPET